MLKLPRSTADDGDVGTETEAAHKAVEELVAHYQTKARAVTRTGVAIGATFGALVGAIPLTPLRAAWPIPSSYGFATLLGGLAVGLLIGYVVGDPRGKLYERMADQARLQLQLEQRISQNDARMAQLLTALTARAAAAAQRQAPQPAEPVRLPPLAPPQPHLTQGPRLVQPEQGHAPMPVAAPAQAAVAPPLSPPRSG